MKKTIVSVLLTTIIVAISISGCGNERYGVKTFSQLEPTTIGTEEQIKKVEQPTKMVEQPSNLVEEKSEGLSVNSKEEVYTEEVFDNYCGREQEDESTTSYVEECENSDGSEKFENFEESTAPIEITWAISTKTEVDTDLGKFPIDEGTYVRVIDQKSDSYVIEWYGNNAEIPINDLKILENITPEEEEQILQRRTAGVVTP